MAVCSGCCSEAPDTAKFCMECGRALSMTHDGGVARDQPAGRAIPGGVVVQCPYCKVTHEYPSQVHTAMNHRSMSGSERRPTGLPYETRAMGLGSQNRLRRPMQRPSEPNARWVTRRFICPRNNEEFIARVILG